MSSDQQAFPLQTGTAQDYRPSQLRLITEVVCVETHDPIIRG